jgi:serine/threonine protein kinase/class 3 adenylate cyclase
MENRTLLQDSRSGQRGDEYSDWLSLSSGPDGLSYLVTRNRDNVKVELRVIRPIAKDPSLVERLGHRSRLIDLCATSFVRRLSEIRMHANLPMVELEHPALPGIDKTLQVALSDGSSWDRLHVAREILATLKIAHRLGLYHGHLVPGVILLSQDGHTRVDFSAINVVDESSSLEVIWSFAQFHDRGELADLVDLRSLLNRLLLTEHADLSTMAGRSRAALKSMLRAEHDEGVAAPSLSQWEAVLGAARVLPRLNDPHGTVETNVTPNTAHEATPAEVRMSKGTDATSEHYATDYRTPHDLTDVVSLSFASSISLEPGVLLGRYRLDEKLGQGGMGVVYRGTDLADGSQVAIKVLRPSGKDSPQAVRRFQKEARLLSGVQNDYVTRLFEVGEDAGFHFIAMEYVAGTTLKYWLADHGPLDEQTALRVIGDVTHALVEAHANGIVHRDIKPENVLLQDVSESENSHALGSKRIKLSDFGIARQINQSASMDVTQAGAILGTPRYMSPEQCRGTEAIGPQADIYALGVTLYELLAGCPPYSADDALRLAAMHCFDPVPAIQKKIPTVSDATAQLISRAMAKDPADRFADASQFHSHIQRVLRGEVNDFEMHPKLPPTIASKLWQKAFTWNLDSSPSQLWPYVSNTERLNRALGLPSVTYRTEDDPKLGLRRFGTFKLGTLTVSWEEHPFEWVEGLRMGVLREFDTGPFKWFMSIVQVKPRPDGGSILEHQIRIEPRNLMGRMLSTIEADWRGGKNLDRVYTRIDRAIQKKLEHEAGNDAFESSITPPKHQAERIEQRTERLVDRGVDPDLASRLGEFIATAPPQVLSQIRPLALAQQWGVDSDQFLKACLFAAAEGLLVLRWDILCPTCRVSASSEGLLSSIEQHTHCVACDYDFRSDLGDAIELVFRVHPEIREVEDAIYCVGGPQHSPHVVAQVRLDPQERLELELRLSPGDYLIRGPRLVGQQRIRVRPTPAPSSHQTLLSELGASSHTPVLRAGTQSLVMTNDLDHLQVMRVERMIPRDDVVTATHASTLSLFRELFPDQVVGQNRPIAADEMTLVATGVCDVDQLYETLGDRDAYEIIGRHLDVLRACIASHRGTVAKTVGEGVLAAFVDCDHAVDAALALQAAIDEEPDLRSIRLSVGVHRGRTLVATINQRIDYFGTTARAVTALPDYAAGALLLTEAVFTDPQVQRRLRQKNIAGEIETIHLPGRPNQVVQRISLTNH